MRSSEMPFGRIDFHANGEFLLLQFLPEFAFRFALCDRQARVARLADDRACAWALRGPQRLHRFGHGANVRGRGAAAAAENAHADIGGFAGKLRKIFRRRFGIDDAVAFALWESRRWACR